jgi:predicted ATPase/DNA-binding SARP family transcriptional activator
VRVSLLGSLQLEHDGHAVEVGGARLRALVACLALAGGRPVRAETLVDAVWDDGLPSDEAHSLQSLVSRLRRTLGSSALVPADAGGYRLAVEPDAVDTARFERLADEGAAALARGDHHAAAALLGDALALWRGPALVDVPAHRFAVAAAAALQARRLAALADRIDADLALGHGQRLVTELEAVVAGDPLNERFAGQLMTALYAAGRQADALATYERMRGALDAALGVPPSPALQAVHLSVLRGDVAPPPSAAEPAPQRSNLTAPLTSFVGREPEIARIDALLADGRLVTLVGPGGAGKTRLAREATGRWVERVRDGVWIVELAPVTDAVEIVPTILGALGLRDTALVDRPDHRRPRDGVARLLDVLRDREAIVVLDNCEHLITDAAQVVETLLGACPRVRVVATSREPLAITGESLCPVPPLALPAPGVAADAALAHPAVRLFADRAAAVQPGFAVDERTVAAVVEVCRRLDGLPLAIELAAARLRSMPLEEIAHRLDDRFRLLTGGSRTALPRHRTLRAVVDWSWELLSEPDRRLARRLAVFGGAGATAESAEAICAGDGIDPADVRDGLAALVDRSLLQVVPGSEPTRYRMLETIREYGLEQLDAAGEVEAVRGAHARWFTDLAVAADPHLRGPQQLTWFRRLDEERDNVLAGVRWLGESGDAAGALRCVVALLWFWLLSGSREEARSWLEFALSVPGEVDPVDRTIAEGVRRAVAFDGPRDADNPVLAAKLGTFLELVADIDDRERPLLAVAKLVLAMFAGDEGAADRHLQAALGHSDPWVRAATMLFAGARAENDGDADETRERLADALRGFEAVGDTWGAALVLTLEAGRRITLGDLDGAEDAIVRARPALENLSGGNAAWVLDLRLSDVAVRRGDIVTARAAARRVLERTGVGTDDRVFAHSQTAFVELAAGDLEAARRALAEPLARLGAEGSDHSHGRAVLQGLAASVAVAEDDLDAAGALLPQAYATALTTADMPVVAAVGVATSEWLAARGAPTAAAEVLGAAAKLRGGDDAAHPLIIALDARLRDALGDDAFAAAYRRGRALTREEAIARLDPVASDAPAVGA